MRCACVSARKCECVQLFATVDICCCSTRFFAVCLTRLAFNQNKSVCLCVCVCICVCLKSFCLVRVLLTFVFRNTPPKSPNANSLAVSNGVLSVHDVKGACACAVMHGCVGAYECKHLCAWSFWVCAQMCVYVSCVFSSPVHGSLVCVMHVSVCMDV